MTSKRSCFVALPFSATDSMQEDGWQRLFSQLIQPAVENYVPRRGSPFSCERQETRQGRWIEEIADKLLTNDLVIVDLTDLNPNVCTELGMRLASGLPLIRMSSTSTERLGNLAGHGVMKYDPDMPREEFSKLLHENINDILATSRPATWLSPERQLLSKRVQDLHRRAGESLIDVSKVTAYVTARREEGYFFYDWIRFCRYWKKEMAGRELIVAIEPSMFRRRSSEVARYGSWPVVDRPLYHSAWPLFLEKDLGRARVWLRDAKIDVFMGHTLGEKRLVVELKEEEFTEVFGDGTTLVVPKVVGRVAIPDFGEELSLWVRFSGMFHPRVLPRMFFFPDGFVAGKWSVEMSSAQSDFGCSVMPLADRAQVVIERSPISSSEQECAIELSPASGSLLLPTDGALVSFFPAGSL